MKTENRAEHSTLYQDRHSSTSRCDETFFIPYRAVVFGCVAQAQQPKKVPRIGYLSAPTPLLSPPVPRQFGWLCASWAT